MRQNKGNMKKNINKKGKDIKINVELDFDESVINKDNNQNN